ncbi:MAG: hypothetical protein A2033_16430 [Bacteroidetes bacterium GWA2_31_9]|nr:MAG: hypothetical protein A2033_16430 [Bacteroidetes bacterium GWA2_31_9]
MKKLFGFIAILGIITSLTYTGCRKGEEDPFLSLRSRDKRIIGTWTLKSSSDVTTTNRTTTDYNNKNLVKTTEASSLSESLTFDGTVFTTDNNITTTTTNVITEPVQSSATQKWSYNTTTEVVIDNNHTLNKKNYSVELEINEDHTYKATITETFTYHYSSGYQTIGGITTNYTPDDTTYLPAETETVIEEGDWWWEDAKDQKIIIVAGKIMKGKLKRLSNKEIILEDITENSDDRTTHTTVWDNYETNVGVLLYNDEKDPTRDTTGVVSKHVVETISRTYTSTWEGGK